MTNRSADQQADEREQKSEAALLRIIDAKLIGRPQERTYAPGGFRPASREVPAPDRRTMPRQRPLRETPPGESLAEERSKEVLGGGGNHPGDDRDRVTAPATDDLGSRRICWSFARPYVVGCDTQ